MDADPIRQLVRETLGCTCPETVFEQVELAPLPWGGAEALAGTRIIVGGRLLIYVCAQVDGLSPVRLAEFVARGRAERDARGLNRFRLVLPCRDAEATQRSLSPTFEAVPTRDDRVHLHCVSTDLLPSL